MLGLRQQIRAYMSSAGDLSRDKPFLNQYPLFREWSNLTIVPTKSLSGSRVTNPLNPGSSLFLSYSSPPRAVVRSQNLFQGDTIVFSWMSPAGGSTRRKDIIRST